LAVISSFKNSNGAITHLSFSYDGEYLATADTERAVAIYRWYHRDEDVNKPKAWIFVGKYISHFKPIASLYFEPMPVQNTKAEDSSTDSSGDLLEGKEGDDYDDAPMVASPLEISVPRLFSLGEDRVLQEYDVGASSIRTGIKIRETVRVDQVATPTCMVVMPPANAADSKDEGGDDSETQDSSSSSGGNSSKNSDKAAVIICANDEYKLKIWDLSCSERALSARAGEDYNDPDYISETTKVCRKTLLAPTYGGPVTKLFVLPRRKGKSIVPSPYLVYSTFERTVGLIMLPLDGNPNKGMATVAHPGEISCVTCSYDGQYLITAGGPDRSVKLWAVTPNALKASVELSGSGIEPYMGLIDGEKDGEFFQEVLDYFYFAQLRSQGINTTQNRHITGHIPITEVVNLMRALGFYPTEEEVHDIKTEICYSHYNRTGKYKDAVDLEEFIRLYVNYRPVFGLSAEQFEQSFAALGVKPGENMTRDELITKLQSLGERISNKELHFAIDSLLGEDTEKDPVKFLQTLTASTEDEPEEQLPSRYQGKGSVLNNIPEQVNLGNFTQTVLGFEDYSTM
jgi:Ca2+-binding EF-hand superfamily protein/WD40 repeat protein